MQSTNATVDYLVPRQVRAGGDLHRLAEIAAALCGTPIAFVAAFDDKTQWIQAKVGFDVESTSRGEAICGTVFDAGRDVVIPDLLVDPRTATNPIVGEFDLRFYAGHPVRDDMNEIVGTVCVLDTKPRPSGLSPIESSGMAALAEQAATIFGLRREAIRQVAVLQDHERREQQDRNRITRLSALVQLGDRLRDVSSVPDAFGVTAEILGTSLGALQAGYAEIDMHARTATIERDWSKVGIASSSGVHDFDDRPDMYGEMVAGRTMIAVDGMVDDDAPYSHLRVPVMWKGRLAGLVYVTDDTERRWSPEDVEFARGVADRMHETVDRLHAQEAREVMIGEIGHRMKNLMAVTRAISMQTLSGRVSDDVMRDLDGRLSAYTGAHDVLLNGGGEQGCMRETALGALSRLSVDDRVRIAGADLLLNERATLALSLLVNELATNAIKHGALSLPEGLVSLEWRIEGATVVVEWRERCGPVVTEPTRKGFGRRILDIGLHRGGGTTLDYAPSGLVATFRAAAHEILAAG